MKPWVRRDPLLNGLATTFVVGCLLSILIRYFFPILTDTYPPPPPEMNPWRIVTGVGIWVIAAAIGILDGLRIRRNNVRNEGFRCHKCGYNLTGNVSGVCPEYGEKI